MNYNIIEKIVNKQLNNMIQLDSNIFNNLILESNAGITYYDMRKFFTIIRNNTDNKQLKDMLKEFIKTLIKLEIKSVPMPVIRKMSGNSSVIFEFPKLIQPTSNGDVG